MASFELTFFRDLVERDPDNTEALRLMADLCTQEGFLTEGLAADRSLAKRCPHDPTVLYNLACSLALTGDLAAALDTLKEAVVRGYTDWHWLMEDPDLAQLRAQSAFTEWLLLHAPQTAPKSG